MIMLKRFFFLSAILLAALGFSGEARALAVSPLKQLITLSPGAQNFTVSITVRNEENEKRSYNLKTLGAKQLGNGTIVYGAGNSAAESWARPEKDSVEILPDQEAKVNFLVSVPVGASAGSYILGLAAEAGPGEGGNAVGISAQVASVLLLQVAGTVTESLNIEKYELPAVLVGSEWPAKIELKNNGTTELPIKGNILVRDWIGREIYNEEINFGQVLLPSSGRSFASKINLKNRFLLPGPYDTELRVVYGLTEQKTYLARDIWYLPAYFWAILFLIAISIIYKIFRRKAAGKI